MDPNTGLDFQRIVVTDTETLDSHSNIITKLELEQRLPEGRRTFEELLKKVGLKLAPDQDPRQIERTCTQFVFQGQCLVLGDSGVGKTSLVKSITGKPFDQMEPTTQGIEQSLVDQKWQHLDIKDLMFGSVNRFFEEIIIQLMFYGRAGNIIFQQSMAWRNQNRLIAVLVSMFVGIFVNRCIFANPRKANLNDLAALLIFCLCLFILSFITLCLFSSKENHRLKVSICYFVINPRGLMIGAFLSVMSLSFISGILYGKFSQIAIIQTLLFVGTIMILAHVTRLLFRGPRSFAIERKCLHPGQLKFNNQRPIEVIFFCRFMINIAISFIFVTAFNAFYIKRFDDNLANVVINCYVLICLVSVPRIFKLLPGWRLKTTLILGGICFLCVQGFLLPSSVSFVMTYLVLLCDTLHKEYFSLKFAISTTGHDHEGSNMFTAVHLEKAVIDNKTLKSALNQKWSSLKLKILDFAGDKEYHAYHHMFLRSQAIYVIVFNMAEFAENCLRDINARIKGLHLWFESVCSHVPPKTPILLVGTHRGNMEKICMESINDHLKKNLWDLFCDELIVNDVEELIFFPVENSDGQNDIGIQTFQRAIMAVAEELKETIGRNIPLSWIQIQDALISMKNDKDVKVCVTPEEFPMVFDNFICTNWSEETLKYFHEKGFIMYLDKEIKRVLLNPEILVDIIIKLVTQQPEGIPQRGFRRDWKLLCDKGMLTKSLLGSILSNVVPENKEAITAFLEEYDLICSLAYKNVPINREDLRPTYFVPALLPFSTDERTLLWNDRPTDKKFFVFFKKFLPEPLFHYLLSRAHKNSKVMFWRSQPAVFRDAGKFWLSPRQPYRLKLMKDMKMVEVTFTTRSVYFACQKFSTDL